MTSHDKKIRRQIIEEVRRKILSRYTDSQEERKWTEELVKEE